MKSYYDLLKNNLIDFNRVLLDNYSKLNINETECLVLYHLKSLIDTNSFDINKLVGKMTLTDNEISEVIFNLVNKGFITIQLNDGVEEYSLDNTYKILGYMFENTEQAEITTQVAIDMKMTIASLEQILKKILTPNEIVVVKKWFYDYKYDLNLIKEEIERVKTKKTASVNMIDRGLFAKTRVVEDDEETLQALNAFKTKYGK